jgi:D-alanyl-D-alanine dipeptidase
VSAQSSPSVLVSREKSHLFGGQFDPQVPNAMPPAVNPDWAGLIGEYGAEMARFYVLEDQGELRILSGIFDDELLHPVSPDKFTLPANGPHGGLAVIFQQSAAGAVTGVEIGNAVYPKRYYDGPSDFFHITPLKPVPELRKEALALTPPPEPGDFRKPDLVQLNQIDPTIKLDIRYATTNNFLGTPLYTQARAFLQRPAAEALVRANHELKAQGYGLIIHDGYRPWYVTKIFWDATPDDKKIFVADPKDGSKHNRGCAVDLSLYDLKTGQEVEMPSGYDEMSDRAYADYPGGTNEERARRSLLRQAMEKQGFQVIPKEWWHFDYKDWKQYPIQNIKFEDLGK